jgi:hypothetical protein
MNGITSKIDLKASVKFDVNRKEELLNEIDYMIMLE